jgi:hypothetical protein
VGSCCRCCLPDRPSVFSCCAGTAANSKVRCFLGFTPPVGTAATAASVPGAGASQHTGASAATGLRRLFQYFSFFSEVSGDRLPVLPGLPSRPVACAGGQCRCCAGRTNQGDGWPHASTALRRWHWRSGDRPSYLSGPWAGRAAKRSGAASRPGNEVFALLRRTGTGQCPVGLTGFRLHCESRRPPSRATGMTSPRLVTERAKSGAGDQAIMDIESQKNLRAIFG